MFKIQHFQALPQCTYPATFSALHTIFNQSDNFIIIHVLPALSAVMKRYSISGAAYFLGKSFALFLRPLSVITFSHFTILPLSFTKNRAYRLISIHSNAVLLIQL